MIRKPLISLAIILCMFGCGQMNRNDYPKWDVIYTEDSSDVILEFDGAMQLVFKDILTDESFSGSKLGSNQKIATINTGGYSNSGIAIRNGDYYLYFKCQGNGNSTVMSLGDNEFTLNKGGTLLTVGDLKIPLSEAKQIVTFESDGTVSIQH